MKTEQPEAIDTNEGNVLSLTKCDIWEKVMWIRTVLCKWVLWYTIAVRALYNGILLKLHVCVTFSCYAKWYNCTRTDG